MSEQQLVYTEINHSVLERVLKKVYKTKQSLYIAGTVGIGKSMTVSKVAYDLAKSEGRQCLEWNKISDKEKQALVDDRGKRENSFVFADLRISQFDPSDLRGLPKLNGKDYVEWKPTLLFRLMSLDGVKGIIFFDEMNLAPNTVQSAAYQIVLDHAIGEVSLNPDVLVIGAGNRQEDGVAVFNSGTALNNRFMHVTLRSPTYEEWTNWALDNELDNRVIAFIQFKPNRLMANLQEVKKNKSKAFETPRSVAMLSTHIKGVSDLSEVALYAYSTVGEGCGMDFVSWLKLSEKIDLKELLEHPEKASGLELSMLWSLVSAVAEAYRGDKKILPKTFALSKHIDPEYFAIMLRMMKKTHKKDSEFVNQIVKCKGFEDITTKYGKYIN